MPARPDEPAMFPTSGRDPDPTDPALDTIMRERGQLLHLAYRFLGSLTEAEDAIQEAYTRFSALPEERRRAIDSPGAWLTTVSSRICLDRLGSARARRERYVGAWLPEPLPGHAAGTLGPTVSTTDPADQISLDESIAMAFLVVLESLTPAQRVAFVLHDVYGYPFGDIAEIVGRTSAACRQLASSARRVVRDAPPGPGARDVELVRAFMSAWERQSIRDLVTLLDPDVILTVDSGGIVPAARHPIEGAPAVADHIASIARARPELTLQERQVNGQRGLVVGHRGTVETVMAFSIVNDRIQRIWGVRNPEKLGRWTDT